MSLAVPASATLVVINNGLAPPNPENVLDAEDDLSLVDVLVRNVGCGDEWGHPCPLPGAATSVELADGAEVDVVGVFDSSSLFVSGGTAEILESFGASVIAISNGEIQQFVEAAEFLHYHIQRRLHRHGIVGNRLRDDHDDRRVVKGVTSATNALGRVTISGGTVNAFLFAFLDESVLEIVGDGFQVDGSPVPFGPIEAITGVLSGVLASGDPIEVTFYHNGYAGFPSVMSGAITLVPVPEPSAALLLASGLACLAAAHRRRLR